MNKLMSLVTDLKNGEVSISLGRLAFVLVFGLACWRWAQGNEIPGTQESMLTVLLAYNLGTKGVGILQGRGSTPEPAATPAE